MTQDSRPQQKSRLRVGIVVLTALLALVFVIDTITKLDIAVPVFYIVVILLAITIVPRSGVIMVAAASIALTLLSMFMAPTGTSGHESGIINGAISIAAIGITTYLALKMVAAEAAAYEARTQLIRISRIQSLGELTASIAHEVNQPLAAIVTSGNACQRWLAMEPPNLIRAQRALERVIADANRASEVITRVRGLAKNELPQRIRFDLPEVVVEAVALARTEIDRHDIVLGLRLDDSLPPVVADRVQIQQVIGNLILNAIDAMRDNPPATRSLDITLSREGEDKILFTIADSGSGLTPATLEHLFDAFWTTKDGGVGLGLTICRSIIESHGGSLSANPGTRAGAVFHFVLPIAPGEKND